MNRCISMSRSLVSEILTTVQDSSLSIYKHFILQHFRHLTSSCDVVLLFVLSVTCIVITHDRTEVEMFSEIYRYTWSKTSVVFTMRLI